MSKWCAIHSDVNVSSGDGFHWIRIPYGHWVPGGKENPFVASFRNKTDKQQSPHTVMRMYLCQAMSSTFCIGSEPSGTGGMMFVVGVRSEKDIFTLKLRFADSEETKIRTFGTQFYVRVLEGDTFSENGDLSTPTYEAIQ